MSAKPGLLERIERALDIYDVDPRDESVAYFSSADPAQMVQMFDAVKDEVKADDRVPLLLKRDDDYVLIVLEKPEPAPRRVGVAALFLLATVVSCVLAGAWLAHGRAAELGTADLGSRYDVRWLLTGALQFALPLLVILGVQEAAQWWMARRHDVEASLPFFLPIPPPFSFLGTLGALQNREHPIPTRRALVEIGAWGPILSFLVAAVVLVAGLAMTGDGAPPAGASGEDDVGVGLGRPLAFVVAEALVGAPAGAPLHPMAIAGWVGLVVTALHLLPGGTLDGGLVARAALGPKARYLGFLTVAALVGLSFLWLPWLLIAVVVVTAGITHPQPLNDVTPLDAKGWALVAATVLVMVLAFTPVPIG